MNLENITPTHSQSLLRRPHFWLIALGLVIAVAVGAYLYSQAPASGATATVKRGDIKATVSANARVRADDSARLAFPLSGLVTQVNVKEGDTVKKGDVLAELDRTESERRVRQAQLALDSRQLDLSRAQAPPNRQDLDIAQQNLKKAALALGVAEDNYKKTASDNNRAAKEIAQADYDIARANFDRVTAGASSSEIQSLKNAVTTAQLELDNANTALAQTQLHAPFDGNITDVTTHAGELLGGYSQVISISDLSKLQLLVEIDEIDVGAVQEGQPVEVRFDAFPGETVQGKLTRLFPAASTTRGASVYQAIVEFDPGQLQVRPGMGATVKIATVEKKDVLLVPSRAIKSAGTQKVVNVRDAGGTHSLVVQVGLSDGNETEIVSGVSEGTQVLTE